MKVPFGDFTTEPGNGTEQAPVFLRGASPRAALQTQRRESCFTGPAAAPAERALNPELWAQPSTGERADVFNSPTRSGASSEKNT